MFYAILKAPTRWILRLVFRLRVVGTENVPARGALLLAANHTSVLDPLAIGAGVRRQLCYLAKAELFRIPLLGPLLRRLNAFPVARDGADGQALRLALGLLREGRALLVFPEGTRGTEAHPGPGRPGAGLLAALSEVPVVPVYVRGTGQALPRGRRWPRPASITVTYGASLRFERQRGRAHYQAVSDEIMAAIGRLKQQAEGPAAGPQQTERTDPGLMPAGRIH